ncbi:DUF2568 domain-containing protein [Oceanobacillus longus]|uniref:DUF2568 domain-containing protein n=1 Tax=Oceanobacillus longus TaxID=930120 RepID=A0ABV8GW78_9BACI
MEIAALVAFSYWGFHVDRGISIKILFGLSTPFHRICLGIVLSS